MNRLAETTIAALYIDPQGIYPRMARGETFRVLGPHGESYCREWGSPRPIDCWDVERDARNYDGPHPVVTHAPCGPYSQQRHNYRGSEHDCAYRALEQVRTFGGVFEHPARSLFWDKAGLLRPNMKGAYGFFGSEIDKYGGFTIQVNQVEWGHPARKPTWLYVVGVGWLRTVSRCKERPFVGRMPTHWCSGNRNNKNGGSVPIGIKVCSAPQRRRTPPLFAEFLVGLAQTVKR